jgi:hypothetical protein
VSRFRRALDTIVRLEIEVSVVWARYRAIHQCTWLAVPISWHCILRLREQLHVVALGDDICCESELGNLRQANRLCCCAKRFANLRKLVVLDLRILAEHGISKCCDIDSNRLPVAHTIPVVEDVLGQGALIVQEPGLDALEHHTLDILNILTGGDEWLEAHRPKELATSLIYRADNGCDGWRSEQCSRAWTCVRHVAAVHVSRSRTSTGNNLRPKHQCVFQDVFYTITCVVGTTSF